MLPSFESRWAFKEWAVVCEAVARGRQRILLRKGGIHEERGLFVPEHDTFWLYPTRFHQSPDELLPDASDLLDALPEREPESGTVALRELVTVTHIAYLHAESQLDRLDGYHILSSDVVRQRFHHRQLGLYVLGIESLRSIEPVVVEETLDFAGCKTWVELPEALGSSVWEPVERDDHLPQLFDNLGKTATR